MADATEISSAVIRDSIKSAAWALADLLIGKGFPLEPIGFGAPARAYQYLARLTAVVLQTALVGPTDLAYGAPGVIIRINTEAPPSTTREQEVLRAALQVVANLTPGEVETAKKVTVPAPSNLPFWIVPAALVAAGAVVGLMLGSWRTSGHKGGPT